MNEKIKELIVKNKSLKNPINKKKADVKTNNTILALLSYSNLLPAILQDSENKDEIEEFTAFMENKITEVKLTYDTKNEKKISCEISINFSVI